MSEATDNVAEAVRMLDMAITARLYGQLEEAIRSKAHPGGCWPSWVYESWRAVKHANENTPWLPELLRALGWEAGTIHDALACVQRLAHCGVSPDRQPWTTAYYSAAESEKRLRAENAALVERVRQLATCHDDCGCGYCVEARSWLDSLDGMLEGEPNA